MLVTPFVVPPLLLGFPTVYDLVADFGGDWDAWLYLYGVTAPVGTYQLNVPAGTRHESMMATGNSKAIIQGAGMGVTIIRLDGLNGQNGIPDHGAPARIDSVSAGSTTVTLKDPGTFASQFTVGWWVHIIGWAMQNFGYGPNNQFQEYARVTNVNAGTGVVTLDRPLVNSYSDDWPTYTVGGDPPNFDSDTGGAATLILMENSDTNNPIVGDLHSNRQWWDQELIIRDLTINNASDTPGPEEAWFGRGRSVLWERCEFSGFSGTASMAIDWTFSSCLFSGESIEIDKSVTELAFYDCTWAGAFGIVFQSSSINHLTLDGCTNLSLNIGGKTFDCVDCTFNGIKIGPSSYGACESGSITNCSATTVNDVANRFFLYSLVTSITAGVITIPYANVNSGANDIQEDLIPGTAAMLYSGSGAVKCFNIISAEQVGTDILYTTDLPASIPELAVTTAIIPHPCPSITVSGCTGQLAPYNGTTNQPMFERCVTSTDGVTTVGANVFGTIVSITINVSQAYTGVQGTVKMNPLSQFGPQLLYAGAHNVVGTQYQPNINLKIAGTRVITAGSTTGTQSGDVIPALASGDNWWVGSVVSGNNTSPHINNGSIGTTLDISGESAGVRPIVTVTIICDQGI